MDTCLCCWIESLRRASISLTQHFLVPVSVPFSLPRISFLPRKKPKVTSLNLRQIRPLFTKPLLGAFHFAQQRSQNHYRGFWASLHIDSHWPIISLESSWVFSAPCHACTSWFLLYSIPSIIFPPHAPSHFILQWGHIPSWPDLFIFTHSLYVSSLRPISWSAVEMVVGIWSFW